MSGSTGNIWLFIMAGGSGTRFWPRSRAKRPKQLLDIAGNESLLSTTLARFQDICNDEKKIILTTELLRGETELALRNKNFRGTILTEPEGKNTAPSIVMAMTWLKVRDPKAIAIIVPADHWISDRAAYGEAIHAAIEFAKNSSHLVTIGINPTRPETGYGYIRSGNILDDQGPILEVERFVEKPKREVAEMMIQEPSYLWNAGMFVWSVEAFFRNLENVGDTQGGDSWIEIFAAYEGALRKKESAEKIHEALMQSFLRAPAISIDYALMEKSKEVAVLPGAFDWNDLGSFESLFDLYPSCEGGVARAERVMAVDSIANLVDAPGRTIALLGVTNMMIVDTGDVLLVAAKEKSQEVKKFVERLKKEGDPQGLL